MAVNTVNFPATLAAKQSSNVIPCIPFDFNGTVEKGLGGGGHVFQEAHDLHIGSLRPAF